MELLENIIQTTLNSFDFSYCIIVNIATYIIIKLVDEIDPKPLNVWYKRLILLFVILSAGVIYYLSGNDNKTILNSAILAPVFWSWVMKPLCKKLNVDYKQIEDVIEN